jgi:hypothetical protein
MRFLLPRFALQISVELEIEMHAIWHVQIEQCQLFAEPKSHRIGYDATAGFIRKTNRYRSSIRNGKW